MSKIEYEATKDPDEILDYGFYWDKAPYNWLDGDTIVTSVWSVPTGLTLVSQSNTTNVTTVFISGGTDGQEYIIANKITTTAGRTAERSIRIKVVSR